MTAPLRNTEFAWLIRAGVRAAGNPRPENPQPFEDWLLEEPAQAQAAQIREHWQAKGIAVDVWVERDRFGNFVVRSDMVGGLPNGQYRPPDKEKARRSASDRPHSKNVPAGNKARNSKPDTGLQTIARQLAGIKTRICRGDYSQAILAEHNRLVLAARDRLWPDPAPLPKKLRGLHRRAAA